jgi:hypothetical protein
MLWNCAVEAGDVEHGGNGDREGGGRKELEGKTWVEIILLECISCGL